MFGFVLLFLASQGSIKKGVFFNDTTVWSSYGSISVEVDGVSKNLPVIAPDGEVVNTDGNKAVLGFNARVYLGKLFGQNKSVSFFYQKLLKKKDGVLIQKGWS